MREVTNSKAISQPISLIAATIGYLHTNKRLNFISKRATMYFPIYLLFAMLSSITYHQFIQLTFYRFYPSIQRTIHSYPSTSYHPSTPVLNHPWLVTNYSFILHKFKVFIIACPRPPSLHSNLQGVKKTHRIICSFRCLVRCRESRGSNFSLSS